MGGSKVINLAVQLSFFCLFLGALLFIVKYYKNGIKGGDGKRLLKILDALQCSSSTKLLVIEYEGEKLLLSVNNNQTQLLKDK